MRIEEMSALRPGLFDTLGMEDGAADVGTADPTEFQAPSEQVESTNHGIQIEHARRDLNKGAGIRL